MAVESKSKVGQFLSGYANCTSILIAVNLVVFLIISWQSRTVLGPQGSSLFEWGAKNSLAIVEGQYWRFVTPVFIHIGIVHFMVNNYSLSALGPYMERVFGANLFLAIYLISGIAGNIASAAFQPNPSAGASGALFGIMGAGFWFEWALSRSGNPQLAKASMVKAFAPVIGLNLMIGFVLPMIDYAAHIGGLVVGVWLTAIFLDLFPNPVRQRRVVRGYFLTATLILTLVVGIYFATLGDYKSFEIFPGQESL
jgi:rhomboid protease GluP